LSSINYSSVAWWAPGAQTTAAAPALDARDSEVGIAFVALCAFTFILLLSPQNWFPFLRPLRIAFLAAGLGIASLLWNAWRYHRPLGLTREVLICFALPAWAFITLPLSYWPGGSAKTLTDLYIKAVIIFWLLPNAVTTKAALARLATVLMSCSAVLAGMGIKNFVSGNFITEADVARIAGYDSGLSGNPNDLALMLNLLIPIGIALFVNAEKTWLRALWLAVVAIDVAGVIVTFSRAGFIALAAVAVMYFFKLVRRPGRDRGWAIAMLLTCVLALPFLPSNYMNRVATVTNINSDTTGSSQIRWRDTVAAAQYVAAHPILGAGIGMDALALNTVRGAKWKQVHNVYFEYAVDLGLPGIGLFLLLMFGSFRAASTSRKRLAQLPQHRDLFLMSEALEISLVVFALSGPFYPVAYNFYFYFMAGLALAARSITDSVAGTVHA
jgi:putative inorganic carbon (HCO3(-)) transporter